jgi:hypothetical protein
MGTYTLSILFLAAPENAIIPSFVFLVYIFIDLYIVT